MVGNEREQDLTPKLPSASREMVQVARELRQRETKAEEILWQHLRGRRLLGRKFRRQHPLGVYVLDFFCDDARLVVEVDGSVHQDPDQREKDRERDEALVALGLTVLRFQNEEVADHLDAVLQRIEAHIRVNSYEEADPG